MRLAQAQRVWQNVYRSSYRDALRSVRYRNVLGVGTGEITFDGGITAICGGNGVGKTTLLSTIMTCLDPAHVAWRPTPTFRFVGSEISATLMVNGNLVERHFSFDQEASLREAVERDLEATWLDAAVQSAALLERFGKMQHLDELLQALSPRYLNSAERKMLSYMVGKDYDACEVYEIDEFSSELPFPYFRVTSGGVTYGSETMGLGEMALFLIYWYLDRAPRGSILLLEEPEAYVSPRSQGALVDIVARFSVQKSLWIILTTHSASVLASIPIEHIRLVYRQRGVVNLIERPNEAQLRSVLGVRVQYTGVFLVEDFAASEFAKAWLAYFDRNLLLKYEVIVAGSESEIGAALNKFPAVGPWLDVIGIFDGDMRSKQISYRWPHTFLPGRQSPEGLLRSFAAVNPQAVAEEVHRNPADVTFALSELEGLDDHDWLEELIRKLGIPYSLLISGLFRTWIKQIDNEREAQQAFDAVMAIVGRER